MIRISVLGSANRLFSVAGTGLAAIAIGLGVGLASVALQCEPFSPAIARAQEPAQAADVAWPLAAVAREFRLSDFLPADSPAVAKRVYRLRFAPAGQALAIRDGANQLWQYELGTGRVQLAERLASDNRRLQDVAYSRDGQRLYGISENGRPSFQWWDTQEMRLRQHDDTVGGKRVECLLDGGLLINGRETLESWLPGQGPKIKKRAGLVRSVEGSVTLLLYNLSGMVGESGLEWREHVAGDTTRVLPAPSLPLAWQQLLLRQVGRAVGRAPSVSGTLLLSPCGNRVVLLDRRAVMLWDAGSDQPWSELNADAKGLAQLPLAGDILTAHFSPNGQWLVLGTVGRSEPVEIPGEVHVIDAVAGRWVGVVARTTQSASAIDFSDDQRFLAVGSTSLVDDRVQIIDWEQWLSGAGVATGAMEQTPNAAERVEYDGASLPTAAALERLDQELGHFDLRRAWAGVLRARTQAATIEPTFTADLAVGDVLLHERLQSVWPRLELPNFQQRERAEAELRTLALQYPEAVAGLLEVTGLSGEARFRVQRTVSSMSGIARLPADDWRRLCRQLQALEGISADWAGQLLQSTTAHPTRSLARQARLSWHIWQRRHSDPLTSSGR